ncbi:hypothetical protein FRB94_009474, partial [Tulasnella sp. JGI-2019a]
LLNKYRRTDLDNQSSSCFGMNSCSLSSGVFHVGDRVQVLRRAKGGGILPIPPVTSN